MIPRLGRDERAVPDVALDDTRGAALNARDGFVTALCMGGAGHVTAD